MVRVGAQDEPGGQRVALVTGAAQGIGQAICRGLASRGANVVGVDLSEMTETEQQVRDHGADWLGLRADVSSEPDTAEVAKEVGARFGRCDILVNNAGIDDPVDWDMLDFTQWTRVLSVNLDAAFLMCKATVALMRERRWGRIVNIASGMVLHPRPQHIAYRASKMGLIGFSRALAAELGDDGITVNVVSPGITQTSMALTGLSSEDIEGYSRGRAIKRAAVPDDVVGAVHFLTGDDSAFITGQTILANGGAAFV